MLPERRWKLDAVLILGSGLLISLCVGMLLTLALRKFVPHLRVADEKFYSFIISGVSFQGVALLLTHAFLKQHQVSWADFLGLDQAGLPRALLLAVAVATLALPIALVLNKLSEVIITLLKGQAEMQPTLKILEVSVAAWQRAIFGLAAIVVAPVVEEILFRGILYPAIKTRGFPKLALFGSAFLFALIHANLMTLAPLFFFAIVLTLLYDKTGALLAPITAHSLFNAVNFFVFIFSSS
jgi:hypothetical protein